MKRGFYRKFAVDCIRKNKRMYIPYILTCILMVTLFYIIQALSTNSNLDMVYGSEAIRYMLKIILACYAEFEQRVGLVNAEGTRSTAQQIVEHYVNGKIGRFTSAEVVAACPMIARSTVLRELKELTRKGVLQRLGTGKNTCYVRRDALEK